MKRTRGDDERRCERRDFPQPVHFIGIGGAGMSGIATVLAELGRRGRAARTSRSRATRATSRRPASPVIIGHDAAQPRRRRPGGDLLGHPRGQPRGARRARRRPAGPAARRDAGARHGHAPRHRRGRHARQDDHLVDDLARAATSAASTPPSSSAGSSTTSAPTPAWGRASGSWPRPTRATAACSTCVPRSRS